MSRAVIMARGRLIEPPGLDLAPASGEAAGSLREMRNRAEREALVEALSRHRGNMPIHLDRAPTGRRPSPILGA